ncbi:Sporulation-control protein spo0M [Streptomyces sp. enrichment culture]|uniref:sporulation protein n=1 Tax=Streptomyces sp. enrichment culture TaxID=1795815 RepID=UPI003F576E09
MAFRTFLSALGVNAPTAETTVENPDVRPGEELRCRTVVKGGGAAVRVDRFALELVTRVEAREPSDTGWSNPGVVDVSALDEGFVLEAGQTLDFTTTFAVPWEMPLTHALGMPLKGARTAVRTVLEIDRAVDRGDFDEVRVHALPAQDVFFQAYLDLGFRFDEAEVKDYVCTGGENQTLRYCQELEFWFPPEYRRESQLETLFIARHDSLDLITGSKGPYPFRYADLDRESWTAWLDEHLRSLWFRG